MDRNLYATLPSLAWVLGHYFYGRTHYMFFAGEFYPYRLRNPRSSNPFMIYQDLFEPWRDNDEFSKTINMYRLALWGGVEAKRKEGVVGDALADRLKQVCNRVTVQFFYPVVCRIKKNAIDPRRLELAGSGLTGSSEFLIRNLHDEEIEHMLFLDFKDDKDFDLIVTQEYSELSRGVYLTDPQLVLEILERRCDSSGIRLPFSIP